LINLEIYSIVLVFFLLPDTLFTKFVTAFAAPVVARDIPEPIVLAIFVTVLTAAVTGDPMAAEVTFFVAFFVKFILGLGGVKEADREGISGLIGTGTAPRAKKANIP